MCVAEMPSSQPLYLAQGTEKKDCTEKDARRNVIKKRESV